MSRTFLLTIPAVALLAACGSPPPPAYDSSYRYGYSEGYRSGYADRYSYGYGSQGYNDRYAYGSGYGYPARRRNLQRPTDY
jgi:hypothetical protein